MRAYRDVAKFSRFRKTAGNIDNYSAHFDLLRKVAESRLGSGCRFTDTITAMVRMEAAMLAHYQGALILASAH